MASSIAIPIVYLEPLSCLWPATQKRLRVQMGRKAYQSQKPVLANTTSSRGFNTELESCRCFFSPLCARRIVHLRVPRGAKVSPKNAAHPVNGKVTNHAQRSLASLVSVFPTTSRSYWNLLHSTATAFFMHSFTGFKLIDQNVSPGPSGIVTEFGTCPQDSSRDDTYRVRQAISLVEARCTT